MLKAKRDPGMVEMSPDAGTRVTKRMRRNLEILRKRRDEQGRRLPKSVLGVIGQAKFSAARRAVTSRASSSESNKHVTFRFAANRDWSLTKRRLRREE